VIQQKPTLHTGMSKALKQEIQVCSARHQTVDLLLKNYAVFIKTTSLLFL